MKTTFPRILSLTLSIFVAIIFVSSTNQAFASPVTITDPSFDVTSLADGQYTPLNGSPAAGWTYNGGTGVFNPTIVHVTDEAQDEPNVAYSNGGSICQILTSNIVGNTRYALSSYVGERSDGNPIVDYKIQLKEGTGHTELASVDDTTGNLPTSGHWVLNNVIYTSPVSGSPIGEPLEVCLSSTAIQTLFDKVSLDATTCATVPPGQVSWWPAENNAKDILYNNPGTLPLNGVTFSPGKVGQAFTFDGSNGVTVPNSASLNVGTGDFSIDAWIKTSSTKDVQIIVDKRIVTPTVNGYALFLYNGKLSLQLGDGTYDNYFGIAPINNGLIHHVAATVDRDSATGINLYVDGILVNTFNPTAHPGSLDNTGAFLIGQHVDTPSYNIVGLIDELELHNVALSSSDITNIYNSGASGKCSANLSVTKFYDANADGVNNDSQNISGWLVSITGGLVNISNPTPVLPTTLPGISLTVKEAAPIQTNWINTTANPVTANLATGDKTVEFGNVCTGSGGGHSKGFWTSKNGKDLFTIPDDSSSLIALNLVNADGSPFNPATYTIFKTWLSSANAKNMAYMLSAQLSSMRLNVNHGFVNGAGLVYAPDLLPYGPIPGLTSLGFISINDLMAAANTSLGSHPNTPAGDASRAYQGVLNDALDRANNDSTFVKPTPCVFGFS